MNLTFSIIAREVIRQASHNKITGIYRLNKDVVMNGTVEDAAVKIDKMFHEQSSLPREHFIEHVVHRYNGRDLHAWRGANDMYFELTPADYNKEP